MIKHKECLGNKMLCANNECSFYEEPERIFKWLTTVTRSSHQCFVNKAHIQAKSSNAILFSGKLGLCYAFDLVCKFQKNIIVWNTDIIHNSLYELIHSVNFTVDNDMLYSNKHSLLFQIQKNFSACSMTMFKTTSGIILSNDNSNSKLNKTSRTINVIDGLILADINFKTFYVYQENVKANKLLSSKLCKTFNSILNIVSETKDGFMQLYDFNGDQLLLQKFKNILYIADCVSVGSLIIENTDQNCYEDFPVKIIENYQNISAFLSQ